MKSMTRLFIALCLFSITLSASISENSVENSVGDNDLEKSHRDERLLFFIKILPEQCPTNIAATPLGTCREYKSCRKISGTSTTRCAKGLGTCCLDTVTCGATTSRNNSYFVNPGFPNSFTNGGTCELTVNRVNNNICQIRIDFIQFNLAQPDSEGFCTTDMMTVTGGSAVPILCGYNTGQHIYVDVNPQGGPLRILVDADTNVPFPRIFDMQISQIPCTSTSRAPAGCLQYFRQASGNVSSFNFPPTLGQAQASVRDEEVTRQISNTDYTVCVRPEDGFCSITWSPNPTFDPFNFFVTGDENVLGGPDLPGSDILFGNIQAVVTGQDSCQTDYVIIPNAEWTNFEGNLVTSDRFCGPAFPPTATSSSTPFNLYVHTDEGESPSDVGNIGFSLNFRQGLTC